MLLNNLIYPVRHTNENSKLPFSDYILVYGAFVLLVVSVYYMSPFISKITVILICILFFITKKDYVWIALFFLIVTRPGNIFAGSGAFNDVQRLPLFTLTRGFSFSTDDIFLLATLAKSFTIRKKYRLLLIKPIQLLFFFVVILLVVSALFFNAKITTLVDFLRILFFYSLLYSFPRLICDSNNLRKFFYLLFPSIIFIFYTSIYFFVTGKYFVYLFSINTLRNVNLETGTNTERMGIYGGGHILILLCFIFALVYSIRNLGIRKYYLIVIATLAFVSIFLTATRVWFIVYSFIFSYFAFKVGRGVILTGVLFFFVFYSLLGISRQTSSGLINTWERIASVFTIGQKNSLATESIDYKIKSDFTRIWQGIKESPVLGWGFSNRYITEGSADIGNWNLIFQVGFLGFFFFIYFWLSYLGLILKTNSWIKEKLYRKELGIIMVGFIGLLIAQFTTHQIFGFNIHPYDHYFLSVYIISTEFFVRESRNAYTEFLNLRKFINA